MFNVKQIHSNSNVFIKNNSYIQEGLLPANPFLFNLDGIAMAVDGKISYNSTVATLIQLYINQKISSQSLGTVGVDDFYAFVENYYNYVFSSSQGLYKLTADFNTGGYNTSEYQFLNYKNVIELILKSHKKNFTFEDYLAQMENLKKSFKLFLSLHLTFMKSHLFLKKFQLI